MLTKFFKKIPYIVDAFYNREIGVNKASFYIFSTGFLSFALNLLSGAILARVLQPAGKGAYTVFLLLPLTLSSLGNLGLSVAIIHFSAKDPSAKRFLNGNSIMFSLLLSLFYTAGLFALYHFKLLSLFGDFRVEHIVLMSIVLPLLLFKNYSQALLHGNNYISARNALAISESLLYGVVITAAALFRMLNVWSALCLWVSTILGVNIITIIFLAKFKLFTFKINIKLLGQSIKMGIKGFAGELSAFIILQSDLLLIQYFIGEKATGIYSIAASISIVLLSLPRSIGLALFPHLTKTEHLDKIDGTEQTIIYARITLIISFLLSFIAIILAPIFFKLVYGSSYTDAVYPFCLLAIAVSSAGFAYILNAQLYGRSIMWPAAVSAIIAAIINFTLNLFFIPKYSFYGAAITSLIAYSFYGLAMGCFFVRIVKRPFRELIPGTGDFKFLYNFVKKQGGKFLNKAGSSPS